MVTATPRRPLRLRSSWVSCLHFSSCTTLAHPTHTRMGFACLRFHPLPSTTHSHTYTHTHTHTHTPFECTPMLPPFNTATNTTSNRVCAFVCGCVGLFVCLCCVCLRRFVLVCLFYLSHKHPHTPLEYTPVLAPFPSNRVCVSVCLCMCCLCVFGLVWCGSLVCLFVLDTHSRSLSPLQNALLCCLQHGYKHHLQEDTPHLSAAGVVGRAFLIIDLFALI